MKTPFIIEVDDYREFDTVVSYFKQAEIILGYEEIGVIDRLYVAVFFIKRDKATQELIDKLKKDIDI